jgi:drug/metabolite transporter (DMT)-like permease
VVAPRSGAGSAAAALTPAVLGPGRSRARRRTARQRVLLGVCLVMVYVVWGTSYPAIRVMVAPAHAQGLPTVFAAGSRLLLAGLILLCIGTATGRGRAAVRRVEGHRLRAAIRAGLLLSFGTGILTVLAARHVESGLLATLMATSPLWTALLVAATTRRVPSPVTFSGLALGIGGVAFLGSGSAFTPGPGIILAAAAALTWSVGSWYISRAALPAQVWLAAGVGQVVSGLALVLIGAASGDVQRLAAGTVSQSSWIALAYLTCVSMTGFTAYSWLLLNANPLVATTHAFVNPVVAALVGPLVLDEHLQPAVLVSAALVGAGALLVLSHDGLSVRRRLRRAALLSLPEE